MKSSPRKRWSSAECDALYGFKRWGGSYFSADKEGHACVHPLADERTIRISDVIKEATQKGIKAPLVIRFQDLLRHRVERLNAAFEDSIKEADYSGVYRGVFPIKVNQLREVIEEIQEAGGDHDYGLEAGSKPELMIAMAMQSQDSGLLICNGYKDDEYIRLALLGTKIGKEIVIVAEQMSEIEQIIRISKEIKVDPIIGFRAKLSAKGEGKWALSAGDNAKFGLTTIEMLRGCQMLEEAGLQEKSTSLAFSHWLPSPEYPHG